MSTLYELTEQYLAVMEMAEENTQYSDECLLDTLESIEADIEDKANAYATIMKELEADKDKLGKEIERLSKRKEKISKNITVLKNSLYKSMKITGREKFQTLLFNFSIKKAPPSVHIIDNEKALLSHYIRIIKEPDKIAIKKALKNGEILEFAEIVQSEGVQIQ